jgi:uncharacterized membrane protein YsdA (DUF1294 family)
MKLPLTLSLIFCSFVFALYWLGYYPAFIVLWLFCASLIAFFLYFKDKRAANKGTWRTPENTLHLWSVLGGWVGAFWAQRLFRHKTKKQRFRIFWWFSIVVNVSFLTWLVLPSGQQTLSIVSVFFLEIAQGMPEPYGDIIDFLWHLRERQRLIFNGS